MRKSEAVRKLQASIDRDGDDAVSVFDLIELVYGLRASREHRARAEIIRQIAAAKRQARAIGIKFDMRAPFFDTLWPLALRMLAGMPPRPGSGNPDLQD
jgi:hypothetical protein